jgi:hypothetical protein
MSTGSAYEVHCMTPGDASHQFGRPSMRIRARSRMCPVFMMVDTRDPSSRSCALGRNHALQPQLKAFMHHAGTNLFDLQCVRHLLPIWNRATAPQQPQRFRLPRPCWIAAPGRSHSSKRRDPVRSSRSGGGTLRQERRQTCISTDPCVLHERKLRAAHPTHLRILFTRAENHVHRWKVSRPRLRASLSCLARNSASRKAASNSRREHSLASFASSLSRTPREDHKSRVFATNACTHRPASGICTHARSIRSMRVAPASQPASI